MQSVSEKLWPVVMGYGRAFGLGGLCLLAGVLVACGDKENKDKTATAGEKQAVGTDAGLRPYVGTSLNDVVVQDLDGMPQKLDDPFILAPDGKPRPVIVTVWATWCAPCLAEMPQLAELGKSGKYTVLAINTDKDTQTVKEFLKQQTWGPGVTVLFDKLGGVTREKLGAKTLPVTFVTTPELTVKMAVAGARQWGSPAMQGQLLEALK